jgi:hypothetical protein
MGAGIVYGRVTTMAGWIDAAIPGLIGLSLVVWPRAFYRPRGDAGKDTGMLNMLRGMGAILILVAAGYLLLKLGSRS